jgi:hypothetical protein
MAGSPSLTRRSQIISGRALPTASVVGGHVSPSRELWSNLRLLLSNQIVKSGV